MHQKHAQIYSSKQEYRAAPLAATDAAAAASMEGSESEAIFDACDLNPQRFINEVLNSVDDVLDGAFDFFVREASAITAAGDAAAGRDRSEELATGVSFLRNLTQGALDKRLEMWEKYCLRHCFTVPDGFELPKAQDSISNDKLLHEGLSDPELDSQLDSLREKLVAVGQESAELQSEIHALEKQSTLSCKFDASVADAVQLYEDSAHEMYKEIGKLTAKLQLKVQAAALNSMEEETGFGRVWKQEHVGPNQGLSASLEDIQESLSLLRSI